MFLGPFISGARGIWMKPASFSLLASALVFAAMVSRDLVPFGLPGWRYSRALPSSLG